MILTAGTGCDNVGWGGIDFELKPPPESPRSAAIEEDGDEPVGPVNEDGPILLAGVREGPTARFVVVGEVLPEGLREYPDPEFPEDVERLTDLTQLGAQWTVFSEGVRIGRLVVQAAQEATAYCGARVEVTGIVELVPGAAVAEHMLALPASDGSERPYDEYASVGHVYDQRVATLAIANDAIRTYGAQRPAQGVLDARDHIQAFQLRDAPGQSIAATFMHEDELVVASPGQGAYALFVIGEDVGGTYQESYSWYRAVEAEGKGAPRYFDHLDWDGDGTSEILLDVFGANRRWFAALSRDGAGWSRSFQDRCGSGSGN